MANRNARISSVGGPTLFSSKFGIKKQSGQSNFYSQSDLANLSESFTSNASKNHNNGLTSTQQLPIDWSEFKNHTFFNSAEAKLNIAVKKTVTDFPFDDTEDNIRSYLDNMTGYERYFYDQLPKSKGYLNFLGGNLGEGTYIRVADNVAANIEINSKGDVGEAVLDPLFNSLSFEFHIKIDEYEAGKTEILFQKKEDLDNHITCTITHANSKVYLNFYIKLNSKFLSIEEVELPLGQFNHVCVIFNRETELDFAEVYIDQVLQKSSDKILFDELYLNAAALFIGTGGEFGTSYATITPTGDLTASLDEFRVFHEVRSVFNQKRYGYKNIFAQDGLKLKFSFNEPSEDKISALGKNSNIANLVLDTAGYGLHSYIENSYERIYEDIPLTKEYDLYCPIIFVHHADIESIYGTALGEAQNFDNQNPNLITKLIPRHYLKKFNNFSGDTSDEEQAIIIEKDDDPKSPYDDKIVNNEIMQSLLYVIGSMWDEMKLFIDYFSKIYNVDYTPKENTVPDNLLQFFAKKYGITLPELFSNFPERDFSQIEGWDSDLAALGSESLSSVQNKIWRRILRNFQEIIKSKGTQHSIKALIRSVGIDPDRHFTIKEYSNQKLKTSANSRIIKKQKIGYLSFSNQNGYIETKDLGEKLNEEFSFEGKFKFNLPIRYPANSYESLFKIMQDDEDLVLNVVANKNILNPSVELYLKDPSGNEISNLSVDKDIFDGDWWNISFGKSKLSDAALRDFGIKKKKNTSKYFYFLRLQKNNFGELIDYASNYKFLDENSTFENPKLKLGNYEDLSSTFLLESLNSKPQKGETTFSGNICFINFWNKYIQKKEFNEHTLDFLNMGSDLLSGSNFSSEEEKLQLSIDFDQANISSSEDGELSIQDLLNSSFAFIDKIIAKGYEFDQSSQVIYKDTVWNNYLNPGIDSSINNSKVYIRSYKNSEKAEEKGASLAPLYEKTFTPLEEEDNRFSIDFSISNIIDRDISRMLGSLEELENSIGDPTNAFATKYKNLEQMRQLYFRRLSDSVDQKALYNFYTWFVDIFDDLIKFLIPYSTNFKGINYMIESHALERDKYPYILRPNRDPIEGTKFIIKPSRR